MSFTGRLSKLARLRLVQGAAIGVALCAAGGGALAEEEASIKIGLLYPLTGPAAEIGKEALSGAEYALSEVGGSIDGHKIELVIRDDQNTPAIGLTEAKRLVERDQVLAIVGSLNAAVGLAIHEYTTSANITYITGGTLPEITQSKKSDTTFRCCNAAGQFEPIIAQHLLEAGMKRGILLGSDYAGPRAALGALGSYLTEDGGEVVHEAYIRVGEPDYLPYFAQVMNLDADFSYGFFFGGDSLRYVNQYRSVGLEFPLIMTAGVLSAASVAQNMGESVDGALSSENYVWTIDTPENKAFVDGYTELYGTHPQSIAYAGYLGMRAIIEALKTLDGDVSDSLELSEALAKVDYNAPAGRWRYDETHNPVLTWYFVEWSWVDGKAVPEVVASRPDVVLQPQQ